jgi:hypothetical protein
MTLQELTNMVLARMNEFPGDSGISFIGSERVMTEALVKNLLTETFRVIAKIVPREWLPEKQLPINSTTLIQDTVHGTGYVILPDDFLLLLKFMVKGWLNPVTDVHMEGSEVANQQKNEYVRGNVVRPVCIQTKKTIAKAVKQVMHYYSLPDGVKSHEVEEALYIPLVDLSAMTDSTNVGLDARVIPALSYMAASLAYGVLEKTDASKYCEGRVQLFIN